MAHPTHFKFTNALIKALPVQPSEARSTDSEYSDSEVSGLKCLVGKGRLDVSYFVTSIMGENVRLR